MSIEKAAEDILHIRTVMDRTVKFGSVSGTAGIISGFVAIASALVAWQWLGVGLFVDPDSFSYTEGKYLLLLGAAVMALSVTTAAVLSVRNAARRKESIWTGTTQRLVYAMAVPLVPGGLFALLLLYAGSLYLALAATLIFYGIAMHSAAAFSHAEFRPLGLLCTASGLAAAAFPAYSLLFWLLGFGLLNIIFGLVINKRQG